ncbi:acetyl-CoA carboxylase, carboxyltransferase component (subunits alpha and beta) [Desulfitobacterium dehalogenans ATCC 51507]|uniref:Acetyl-CoA carboxylase, carboxyltransferase component (Subunits alpha and beta) n=2 Tax=Desulfitobacterium dehalogenans TaxID=36854 RepID=I4A5K1_DESDJ|nr:acetyl-CoA carboxylase, carboxyltransferase component (subunits alpha and beta) [Desulfitobacterium dehalogenans ATCC 51507]
MRVLNPEQVEELWMEKDIARVKPLELIHKLMDEGTFVELQERMPETNVLTGLGKVNGRRVYAFAQNFETRGGSIDSAHANKIIAVMDMALNDGVPIVGFYHSVGARIQDGILALDAVGKLFNHHVKLSGKIPQISVIMGSCAGGAAYCPALTDFIFMIEEKSKLFVTGPKVVQAITGERSTAEELGGTKIHGKVSGVNHFESSDEESAIKDVRRLLSYLPQNHREKSPRMVSGISPKYSDPKNIVPVESNKPYDMLKLIEKIVDNESFIEIQKQYAKNTIIGFGRFNGIACGLIANQPKHLAGALDVDASEKIACFIRLCSNFNLPVILLEDTVGFMPGVRQESSGLLRYGADIVKAFAEASAPKITVIIRKAFGGAYIALNSKAIGATRVYAWTTAEIGVMGIGAAVNLLKKDSASSESLERSLSRGMEANLELALSHGVIDEVIEPYETRQKLIEAIEELRKREQLAV